MDEGRERRDDGGGTTEREEGREERREERREHPRMGEPLPFSQQVGRVVLGVVAVLFVIFSLFNLHGVAFDWIFGEWTDAPLILLLLGSFALGAVVGSGIVWRQQRVRHGRWQREESSRS